MDTYHLLSVCNTYLPEHPHLFPALLSLHTPLNLLNLPLSSLLQSTSIMAVTKFDVIELPPKTHFVLVHGLGSGGWCWFKIRTLLEEAGHKVSSPDLKSAGVDQTNVHSILTIEEYDEPLIQLLSNSPETERIVLVGHSAGGLSLAHMMHKFPQKVHMAFFIAATMLRNGFVTEQDLKDGLPSEYANDEKAFNLSTPQDKTLALLLKKSGPVDVLKSTKFSEDEGVDEVKRICIKTMHDLILKPEQQEAMINKWPPIGVFTLDSDHCPNLSMHLELFNLLVKAAATM